MRRPVTLFRRIVQVVSLLLLVYGGVFFAARRGPTGGKESVDWAVRKPPVVRVIFPTMVCIFNPEGGLFEGCIHYFFMDKLGTGRTLLFFLFQVLVFLILAFFLGRLWCGFVCPLATVGDGLDFVRRKLGIAYRRLPPSTRSFLRFAKWFWLAVPLGISAMVGAAMFRETHRPLYLNFCKMCPSRAVFTAMGGKVPEMFNTASPTTAALYVCAWMFLGVFVLTFFLRRRAWCRLCPVGLYLSFFNRGGGLLLEKDPEKCNKCAYCVEVCPVEHTAVYEEKTRRVVSHGDCIMCLKCVESCPRDGCLKVKFLGLEILRSRFRPGRKTRKAK